MIKLIATLAAKISIARQRKAFDQGKVTYQGIFYKVGELLNVADESVLPELRRLLASRCKAADPQSGTDIVLQDSLNQLAAILPGSKEDPKKLIYAMIQTSFQSMENMHAMIAKKRQRVVPVAEFKDSRTTF